MPVLDDNQTDAAITINGQIVSPIHKILYTSLHQSKSLESIHIDVRNESYWYAMRKRLGPRKQATLIVDMNVMASRWESYIYKMKPREEDFLMVPQKHFLLSHKSRWTAYKHCETACNERDSDPIIDRPSSNPRLIDPSKILSTHFRILVVSEAFDRLSHTDRLILIYNALLDDLGTNILQTTSTSSSSLLQFHPKMNFISYYGDNVCQLNLFRFLLLPPPTLPTSTSTTTTTTPPLSSPSPSISLLIEAKTPSQWRMKDYTPPVSERFGSAHMGLRSSRISSSTVPASHKKRIKALAGIKKSNTAGGNTTSGRISPPKTFINKPATAYNSAELLGVDASISGVTESDKTGGIYGHFFSDLSPAMRGLVMEEHRRNKTLIQHEGNSHTKHQAGGKSHAGRVSAEYGRKRSVYEDSLSEYDKGTKTELEMVEDIYIRTKTIERWTVRLQRLWRLRIWTKAIRIRWRRELAAIHLQRSLRGYFGRCYVRLLRQLRPMAAKKIQHCYRVYKQRIVHAEWLKLVFHAARRIFPIMKRFIKRCAESSLSKYHFATVKIQCVWRKHLARMELYRRNGLYWMLAVLPPIAALKIQRCYRGYRARIRVIQLWEILLYETIDKRAVLLLQRVYRGVKGRQIALRKRKQRRSAVLLQRWARAYLHKLMSRKRQENQLYRYKATVIQRIFRGRIDREIVKRRLQKKYYLEVYIPAVITVQSLFRMTLCRRSYRDLIHTVDAVCTIQRTYRDYLRRLAARERHRARRLALKSKSVIQMQRMVRGWLARINAKAVRYKAAGQRMLAAKQILRAWVNYCHTKRLQKLLEEHRMKRLTKRILVLQETRGALNRDIEEIQGDINAVTKSMELNKQRLKELNDFTVEANLRLPTLHVELVGVSDDDIERGWVEAFGIEYECLVYQNMLAKQEIRLRKVLYKKQCRELLGLQLEMEESDLERFELATKEIESTEYLRSAEIGKIERRLMDKHKRDVRMEVCRWKIANIRKNVIVRNRLDYKILVEK
eukprot:gene6103-12356_t